MPVRTGSIVELVAVVERATERAEVVEAFREAAGRPPLQGVMDVLEEEWPSARIVGDPHSSIVDLPLAEVCDKTLITVTAWYDNEMGFSVQLARVARTLASAAA